MLRPYHGLLCAALLIATIVLSGCNLPVGEGTVQPPAPIDPGETGTSPGTTSGEQQPAAPAEEPSATPLPTPTPAPAVTLEEGERMLHNGAWDEAVAEFNAVLTAPGAAPGQRASAAFGLGEASLRGGNATGAVQAFDLFLTENPEDPRAPQATFLRGEAKLALSDWEGAIADFQQYLLLRPGLIDSYAHERIADAYIGLGQWDNALNAFDAAITADRHLVGTLILRERVATVNRSLGNYDAAIAQYDAILEVAQNTGYRASIESFKAQTLLEAGRPAEAYELFTQIFNSYPFTNQAFTALVTLLDAGITVDPYQRGLVNYNNANWEPALASFLDYVARVGLDYPPDVHLFIAESYRQLGNVAAAETELLALINRFNPEDGDAWAQAHLDLAALQASVGNTEGAFATLDAFIEENRDLPQAADALAQAALLAESLGDLTRAGQYYRTLGVVAPGDERAAAGQFRLGFAAYRNNDIPTAEGFFGQASQNAADADRSLFWLGKTLQSANRPDEANALFNQVIANDPHDYFALRAEDQLMGTTPFTPVGSFALPPDPDAGRDEADAWMVSTFALEGVPPFDELRADIAADPRLARAEELWALGLITDARTNFEAVREAYASDPLASYQLAIYFRDVGVYRSSLLAARAVHRMAGVHPLDGPEFIARLHYPTYYSDLVLEQAGQYGLDPLFVFSLIWQESQYEGFAVSPAAAQGLMQIWPPTGEDIASRLNWPNYRTSELQRPVVSVTFGTWLLNEEARRFDNDPYAMLTAYNAGPGNTATWRDQAGGDPDVFLEVITIAEPRTYVIRIYEHYNIYQALYGQ